MKFIAWDTSSKTGALVAMEVCEGSPRIVTELFMNVELTHSEKLLLGIHQLLESASWKLDEIDFVGVGVGPGSFTGLRVGLTTARTFAFTLNKPLVGISSLAALARPVALHYSSSNLGNIDSRPPVIVVAATDACKGELFVLCGLAQEMATGVSSLSIEKVQSPQGLVEEVSKKLELHGSHSQWIAVGEGRQRYLEDWAQLPRDRELAVSFPYSHQIQGRYVGILAWEAFLRNESKEGLQIFPQYLRASDAEIKLKAGLLKNAPV